VDFDRSSLTLDFVDTFNTPSVLIARSSFTLWWPSFGIDAQAMAFGEVDFSKVPEPFSVLLVGTGLLLLVVGLRRLKA
jgi:hypothetical protein